MEVRRKGINSTKELKSALNELRAALVTLEGDDHDPAELLAVDAQLVGLCARCVERVETERAAWVAWSPGAPVGAVVPRRPNASEAAVKEKGDGQ